jgi:DNA repair protein RadA/Sms
VIEKHLGLRLSDQDLYINVAGGIRIAEVGAELALACALYSARTGVSLPSRIAIAGELSLAGEVRPVRRLGSRVKTAGNLGFLEFLGPLSPSEDAEAGSYTAFRNIRETIKTLFSTCPS